MRTDVPTAVVRASGDVLDVLALATDDLRSAGRIADLRLEPGGEQLEVAVTL
jgi:hypothetical protein